MRGSEKQIQWASKIKAEALESLSAILHETGASRAHKGLSDPSEAAIAILRPLLEAQDDAAWWIDNRSTTAIRLAVSLASPEQKSTLNSL